ncbi:hypothetical protein Q7O_002386 [Pectobacterium carotovorum subsp. carotovorum PCCS1]|nr:hypothetical protein [Pectobacterium carotovorum subsp. carotovorum PCCS1]
MKSFMSQPDYFAESGLSEKPYFQKDNSNNKRQITDFY